MILVELIKRMGSIALLGILFYTLKIFVPPYLVLGIIFLREILYFLFQEKELFDYLENLPIFAVRIFSTYILFYSVYIVVILKEII